MRKIIWILASSLSLMPCLVMAQDKAPATAPAENSAQNAPAQPANAPSNEPGDIIANYFSNMADIVAQNMDNPSAVVEKFSAYIKENEKAMRAASKKFESKLNAMKAADAEVYRETVQRKITPPLNRLISLLVDFGNRYTDDAKKLDSMLKIDAKYAYEQ